MLPAEPGVRHIAVGPEQAGQRIDNFLLARLKGVPRSHVYRILRTGQVRVNRHRIKPDYRLRAGDEVRMPPVRTSVARAGAPAPGLLERIQTAILYEDKGLLLINKPSGVAAHGGSGVSHGVIEALRALRPDAPRLELVHRLDRDTSGCLLVAKKRSVLRALHAMLRNGEIEKRYRLLVKGVWRGGARTVKTRLQKGKLQSGERMVRIDEQGKIAKTVFEPVAVYAQASLLEACLLTGRTHQIRVHAAHIDHPVAGDAKYGDKAFNCAMRERGLKRMFLHACRLRFEHPDTGDRLDLTAPLQPELQAVLEALEGDGGQGDS